MRSSRGSAARRALLAAHRWLGLTLGVVLMSSGLTGALLVVAKPLDRAWNAPLHFASGALDRAALDAAAVRLRAEFPAAELVLRLPRASGDSVQVYVRGAWHGEVFLDAASGRELGRRGETQGFFNALFEWHSSLLAEGTGKAVLALAAGAGLILSLLGVVLWWPASGSGWRAALRIRRSANLVRQVLDLHRVGGALLVVLVVVSIASGLYMAWRPVSAWVDAVAGTPAPAARSVTPPATSHRAPVSALMAAAERALPGGRLSMVVLPAGSEHAVRVRKRMADEPHPNGLSSVWLHPGTGEVVDVVHWRQGGAGLLGFEFMYPLHIGELGGAAHRVLVAFAGLALFLLGASGAWIWWRRGRQLW